MHFLVMSSCSHDFILTSLYTTGFWNPQTYLWGEFADYCRLPVITQVILPSFCMNKLQMVEIFCETCPAILPHCMMQTTYLSRYSYTLIHVQQN